MNHYSEQQEIKEISGDIWVLFDPSRETISEELSTNKAQLAIANLKSRYLNRYFIWNSEWAKWKPLSEFLRSSECPFTDNSNNLDDSKVNNIEFENTRTLSMKLVEPRKALRIHSTVSEVNTNIVESKNLVFKSKRQFNGEDLVWENTNSTSNLNFSGLSVLSSFNKINSMDKYKIQLLLVHPKGQTFRTAAKDISISGTYAERIVPAEFHSGIFNIIISNNLLASGQKMQICLNCKVVSHDGSVYLQYVTPNNDQLGVLRGILANYREGFEGATIRCG
mgnify:FL=1